MNKFGFDDKQNIFISEIEAENKFLKLTLDFSLILGSLGFIIAGFSSFLGFNLLFLINTDSIVFFPQGLIMCFYGFFGLLIGLKQIIVSYCRLGQGYNFFNKINDEIIIYRLRFPLSPTNIYLIYKIIDVVKN